MEFVRPRKRWQFMSVQTEGTDTAGGPAVRKARIPGPPNGEDRGSRSPGRGAAAAPYLLLLPALLATVVLLGWPLVKNGMLSFQNLNPRQLIQHLTEWNGVENYRGVLS